MQEEMFKSNFLSKFMIHERKKRKISIETVSKVAYHSVSSISRYEKENNLTFSKVQTIFDYFSITEEFINKGKYDLKNDVDRFIEKAIEINDEVDTLYNDITEKYSDYRDTLFEVALDMIDLIYLLYSGKIKLIKESTVKSLIKHLDLLTDEYKCYGQIYLGRYFHHQKNFAKGLDYYNQASVTCTNDQSRAMQNYFLSLYYIERGDITMSLTHISMALQLFTKLLKFNRLVNCNIIVARQYRTLRLYQKALEIDIRNYQDILDNPNLKPEKIMLCNNIAWTYLLSRQYNEAILYYEKIDESVKLNVQYFEEAFCHFMLNDSDAALKICKKGLETGKINNGLYYDILNWMYLYFCDSKQSKGIQQLIKLYEKNKDKIRNDEKTVVLTFIMTIYERKKQFEKAYEYSSKLLNMDV